MELVDDDFSPDYSLLDSLSDLALKAVFFPIRPALLHPLLPLALE